MALTRNFGTRATYAYVLCGWHTLSEIPLTNVPALGGGESSDIIIQIAAGHSPIPKNAGRVVFDHALERTLIRIADVADFEVNGGRLIRVWPVARASQKDIEIFLFGPAWASLCHQRGLLPLHASAVRTPKGIAAFAGHSGAGKSTTAALMVSLGYELVTDDILPISFNHDSTPGAWPYLRRLKLQASPIAQLGLIPSELVSENRDKEKYFVFPDYAADDGWSRLDRIYLLETGSTNSRSSTQQITGADAVGALVDQTYHFKFVLGSGRFREHLELCSQVASRIDIYRLALARSSGMKGKEISSFIRSHLQQT